MKFITGTFGEKAALKPMFAAMLRAAEQWRALRVTGVERRRMDALRRELDQNYEETTSGSPRLICKPKKFPAFTRFDRESSLRAIANKLLPTRMGLDSEN